MTCWGLLFPTSCTHVPPAGEKLKMKEPLEMAHGLSQTSRQNAPERAQWNLLLGMLEEASAPAFQVMDSFDSPCA
jgi:hypothetical protein